MSIIKELNYYSSSMSLLVVEDEKELNNELVSMLGMFFQSIDYAYDGKEALEKYKLNKPDIILTDITMPKMDGITMSRKIKIVNPNQSIIVLSAHDDTKFMIELIDIRIDQFILKPFDKNTLFYKLLKVAEEITYKKEFDLFYKEKLKQRLSPVADKIKEVKVEVEVKAENIIEEVMPSENDNHHFSHTKEDANNFMDDIHSDNLIWQAFKDDIPELMQLSVEFGEDIEKIDLEGLSSNIRDSIVQIIHGYILIFSTLDQMVRMTEVLSQLTQFLEELEVDTLTEQQLKKLKVLEFIHEDIKRFLQTVFVYQDTVDIYYLEDSLESSIMQMRNDVLGIEVEEDELELF